MLVILDALGIGAPGGGRSATLNLIEGLLELESDDRFVLLVSDYERFLAREERLSQIRIPPMGRLIDRLRLQALLPRLAASRKADLVHHAKNLGTFFLPCPSILTIYDLTILAHPELFPLVDVLYWRRVQPLSIASSAKIIAISRSTAQDLHHYYSTPLGNVAIIYPGYDPLFDLPPGDDSGVVRQRYGVHGDYLLHVGSISRKKNLVTLVKAFAALRSRGRFQGQLVLVGREYSKGKEQRLSEAVGMLGLTDSVIFTGPVPLGDLRHLYAGATACVFPSLHEGFGLVPVEAMASGVPVVASDCSAVREVVSDAGILVGDVQDHHVLADAIGEALGEAVHRRLAEAGRVRARCFSRSCCAADTLRLYRDVTENSKRSSSRMGLV